MIAQLQSDFGRCVRLLVFSKLGSPEEEHARKRLFGWLAPIIQHWGLSDADKQVRLDWMALLYCRLARELIRKSPKLRRRSGKNPRHGTVATAAYLEMHPGADTNHVRAWASKFARDALKPERLARLEIHNFMPEWEAYLDTGKSNRNWFQI